MVAGGWKHQANDRRSRNLDGDKKLASQRLVRQSSVRASQQAKWALRVIPAAIFAEQLTTNRRDRQRKPDEDQDNHTDKW